LVQQFPDLQKKHEDKIKILIADGTPVYAKAEALLIKLVHKKTWKIITMLVHLEVYQNSLDGEDIAKHVKTAVAKTNGLELQNLRTTSIDRAGTNKKAMKCLHAERGVRYFRRTVCLMAFLRLREDKAAYCRGRCSEAFNGHGQVQPL
jgi:hypothetical protein